jgi:hypothetical protein
MFDNANAVPANMVRTPTTAPPVIFPVLLMAILLTGDRRKSARKPIMAA